ncbi:serine/threonine-protein kinase [Kribbella sp. NPDC048928]|uniref:serine/threonine-protein kinase n=1 Tax=Kribbella sp. NPDC048928 TaxID=3364111 RepID=UPI003711B227
MADVFAGRFELLEPIGSGGAGTVWQAWDRRQERFCAAKVLRQRDAGALLRFVREQGRRLDHPNVLSPYGWAADDDLALLAMDLVGGGSVDHLVADFGPLPPRLAAELLSQLLGALDKIHTAGVVHRDVKPANLLLETTGTARPMLRLSDFGIAIALGEPRLTVHGTVVGTPGYLAPEALAGAAPSPAQDLYAAGVTAWQLLTGTEPPERGTPPTTPAPPTSAMTPTDAGADDPIWTVVTALTSPDPTNRPQSAAAALADLAPILAEPLKLPVRTADGEVVEVFNHLPPPPPHHTQPPTTPTLELPPDAPHPSPDAPPHPAPEPAEGSAVGPAPESAADPAPEPAAGPLVDPAMGSAVGSGGGPAVVGRVGRRVLRLPVVVGVVVVLALGGGGVAALRSDFGPFGDSPSRPTTDPSKEPSGDPSAGPTSGATQPTTAATDPPVTRSADPSIRAGGDCGWQAAGSAETAADGTRVECRQQGQSYRWVKAG